MRRVDVRKPRYSVHIGPGVLEQAASFCQQYPMCFVLSDTNVGPLYGHAFSALPHKKRYEVPAGESTKSFMMLERVLDQMVASGCDRKSGFIALGGGVVGDLGGLAAALYMRGIGFVQVPTSLLAMVDSSVGGKTGVNLHGGKNLAGTFYSPREVYADTATLATLPDVEFRSGLGEVVKCAVIHGDLLETLQSSADAILRRDPEVLATIIEECVAVKARIVERDPYEEGLRKTLNLGHTFAHAIEHQAGYGTVPHGIAVAVGLALAFELSRKIALHSPRTPDARVTALLETFGLPWRLAQLDGTRLDPDGLMSAMRRDKKSRGGKFHFVLPFSAGMVHPDVPVEEADVRAVLEASLAG
jgi:3-dehydroquinate synthase